MSYETMDTTTYTRYVEMFFTGVSFHKLIIKQIDQLTHLELAETFH